MFNSNKGYMGNKMSVRAREAYDDGEMPLSKWNKAAIIEGILDCIYENDLKVNYTVKDLNKLTKNELERFLERSSWHHTGSYYNETNFYQIDEESVENFTLEELNQVINYRKPRAKPVRKEAPINMYITARVRFYNWEGTRKHPKKVLYDEIIRYRTNDKLVKTSRGTKRLSNMQILEKIEQKTKFADPDKLSTKKIKK